MADTRIPIFNADGQTAYIDYRSEATNGDGRQVVTIGDPSVNANVVAVKSEDVSSSSTEYGMVVRLAGSAQINAVAGTLGVNLGKVDGTIQVNVGKIYDLVNTELPAAVALGDNDTNPTTPTTGAALMLFDGSTWDRGRNVAATGDGQSGNAMAVGVFGYSGATWDRIRIGSGVSTDALRVVHAVDVASSVVVNSGTLTGITNSINVHLLSTGGTVAVKIDPGYNVVNAAHTIVLPSTVSGSTSGVSASGVTLVSPESGRNIKVFAYSIQSTGAVSQAIRFVNGAGGGQTEFWRPLVTEGGVTGVQGANLAVAPPGYIFATGVNVTLAIDGNDGGLVHYSIGYFKESA